MEKKRFGSLPGYFEPLWGKIMKNPIMEKSDAGAACLSSVGDHIYIYKISYNYIVLLKSPTMYWDHISKQTSRVPHI